MVDAAGGDPLDPERPGRALWWGWSVSRNATCRRSMSSWAPISGKSPSDSTFRLLLAQLDVPGFETLLRDWMAAQPGVAEELDTLMCDGKILRGSIAQNNSGAARFIAQVSLYSQSLGVAIAQTTYGTDARARSRPYASCWRR